MENQISQQRHRALGKSHIAPIAVSAADCWREFKTARSRIKGDPDHPSSRGDLCLKAVYLPETSKPIDRLLYPQIRSCQDGAFKRASWGQAMNYWPNVFAPSSTNMVRKQWRFTAPGN